MSYTLDLIRIQNQSTATVRPVRWNYLQRYDSYYLHECSIGGETYKQVFYSNQNGTEVGNNETVWDNITIGHSAYSGYYVNYGTSYKTEHLTMTMYEFSFSIGSGFSGSLSRSSGSTSQGKTVSCTVTPSSNYTFECWKKNGQIVSTSQTLTLTGGSSAEGEYVAYGHKTNVTVSAYPTPSNVGGSAFVSTSSSATSGTSSTSVAYNGTVYVTAVEGNTGRFLYWSDGSTAKEHHPITGNTSDTTVYAYFSDKYVSVGFHSQSSRNGSVYASLTAGVSKKFYNAGDSVTVRAIVDDVSTMAFRGWFTSANASGSPVSTSQNYTFTFGGANVTLYALISEKKRTYTVASSNSTYGSATIYYGENDVGNTYAAPFNTTVRLVASIVDADIGGSHVRGAFLGWYAASDTEFTTVLETSESWSIVVPANFDPDSYVARFDEAQQIEVTCHAETDENEETIDRGSIEITSGVHISGDLYYSGNFTFTATPFTGYHVAGWKVGGNLVPGEDGNTLTVSLDQDCAVAVIFVTNTYTVSYSIDSASAGAGGSISLWKFNPDQGTSGEWELVNENARVEHGTVCRVIVSYTEDGDLALRRLVATSDGTDETVTPTQSVSDSAVTETFQFSAQADIAFVAYFGNVASVAAVEADPENATGFSPNENGEVAISTDQSVFSATSVSFTYGETLYLRATNNTAEGSLAFFTGWREFSGGEASNKIPGAGMSYAVAPTPGGCLIWWAEFADTKPKAYVKLTNHGTTYGAIGMAAIDEDAELEQITETEWNSALNTLPSYSSSSASHSMAGPPSPTALSVADTFYKMNLGSRVYIQCVPNEIVGAVFASWGRMVYTHKTRTDVPSPGTTVSTSPNFEYAPSDTATVFEASYNSDAKSKVSLRYSSGCDSTMGTIALFPTGSFPVNEATVVSADYTPGVQVSAVAIAKNGYRFNGWYEGPGTDSSEVSGNATYVFTKASNPQTFYASFVQDTNAVYKWEGGTANKTLAWRSRRHAATQPLNLSAIAVHADGYPVRAFVHYASSPDDARDDGWNTPENGIEIESQEARRLPMARPEKYVELEVRSEHAVLKIAASTSMQGLIG